MKLRFAALVLLALAARPEPSLAQKPESRAASRPDAAALCQQLRGDDWTLERFQSLMAALVAQKQIIAAEWWVRAAENAIARGKLPASAAAAVAAVRRDIEARTKPSTDVRLVWTSGADHFKKLADKNAFAEAAAVLATLDQIAASWPETVVLRDAAAMRARLPKEPFDGSAPADDKEKKTTADLAARLRKAFAARTTEAVAQFRRFGCRAGFAIVDDWLRNLSAEDRFGADLKAFRGAAREYGIARPLVIHVLSPVKIKIHQDGVPLAAKDGAFDATEWREVTLAAVPGEIVALEVEIPPNAPKFVLKGEKEQRYAELYAEALYDGTNLGRDAWQVGSLDQARVPKPRVGGILFAEIGPNERVRTGGKIPICMNYAEPTKKRDEELVIDAGMTAEEATDVLVGSIVAPVSAAAAIQYDDAHKRRESKVPGSRSGFFWATTMRENPVYFIIVPKDAAK